MFRAHYCQANLETRFIINFKRDHGLIIAELEHWRGVDTNYVVPIIGVILDDKTPKLNCTLEDVLAYDLVDLTLARKVLKDVVVGLILLHTDIIFFGYIKLQIIIKCGSSRKLTDLQYSRKIGDATCWGYFPPEVVITLLNSE